MVVVIVIDGTRRILAWRRFLPRPRPRPNRVRPPTPTPPPPLYAVIVVVIVINGARRILTWLRFLPQPRPFPNRVCPPTPPPPPYAVVVVIVIEKKRINDNNTINSGLQCVDRPGEILITYIAVVTGGRGTKVSFVVWED